VAYAGFYPSETLHRAALPAWLPFSNHHRPHSSTGGKPAITRLTNLPDHHIWRSRATRPPAPLAQQAAPAQSTLSKLPVSNDVQCRPPSGL
jgi:hypothetical protein